MGFENRRSPPVLIYKPGFIVLAVFHLSARRALFAAGSPMFNTVGYPGCGPRDVHFLHKVAHNVHHRDSKTGNDRMTGRVNTLRRPPC